MTTTPTPLTDNDLRAAILLLREHPSIIRRLRRRGLRDRRYAAALWRVIERLEAATVNDSEDEEEAR